MKILRDLPIFERVNAIEEALKTALDRGPEMEVGPSEPGSMALYVIAGLYTDARVAHDLHDIARDIERALS